MMKKKDSLGLPGFSSLKSPYICSGLLTNNYRIMSDLEKILNDDLLKCEIIKSVQNANMRVSLIKWTYDGLFSIAVAYKDTDVMDVIDINASDDTDAYMQFDKKCGDISAIS